MELKDFLYRILQVKDWNSWCFEWEVGGGKGYIFYNEIERFIVFYLFCFCVI